ncbi:sigma-E processing peptidase SpoIIGA [Dethiobacter alkaliphilus]|uniref:sigma-E processing peptidase SpoIIGA n=1 Tax=Dethiobacter alkaliphilus TaxID=427926 RepID=UPI0022275BD9|nr:sigma-E processing peptidase SpoIIGA [Dethiobacter alkaliphilus]MCW3491223.1 sigma-E processing peptidase SpoIIGA [Dethiobacter alkaliphilus]
MYIEDLLALNFMMNTALLYLTACLTGRELKMFRLASGGFLAALYSLVIFLPVAYFVFSWVGKVVASVLIVAFTFRPGRIMELLRLCGAFFLASFFLAGTVFALYFFGSTPAVVQGGVFYIAPPRPGMLFTGVLIAFILMVGVWHLSERQRRNKGLRYRLTLRSGNSRATARALVDTGNQLRDPVSGRPLNVASFRAIRDLLPQALQEAYLAGEDPVSALGELSGNEAERFGVVPFRSLENSGMLVTFRPDTVTVEEGATCGELSGLAFAITAKGLSLDNDAEILLHPSVLENIGGVGV